MIVHYIIPWEPDEDYMEQQREEYRKAGRNPDEVNDGYCCDWCCPDTVACGGYSDDLKRPEEDGSINEDVVTCEECKRSEEYLREVEEREAERSDQPTEQGSSGTGSTEVAN